MDKSEELLLKGLEEIGLSASKGQAEAFMAYLFELKKWNRVHNLTSLRTDRDIVVKHFLDSCLYLKALGEGVRSIADVGSGAGLPGVPIKILRPEIKVLLIEPAIKKVAFLRHIVRMLSLKDAPVIAGRVEDVKDVVVDAAVTRALFKAGEFIRQAGHLVREGGVFVLSKGPRVVEELDSLDMHYELMEFPLPFAGASRRLLVIPRRREA